LEAVLLQASSNREWRPPEQTSEELDELVKLALFIYESYPPHKHRNEYNIDFTSILLAFLYARNDLSDWFRIYVRQANIKIKDIHAYKDLNPATLEEQIENLRRTNSIVLSQRLSYSALRPTYSAKRAFAIAQQYMQQTKDESAEPILDVRHLMGAYIYHMYTIEKHYRELIGWEFDYRNDWPNTFLSELRLRQLVSPTELQRWKTLHKNELKNDPNMKMRLFSHILSDTSTIDDKLDYLVYSYAIARFITDDNTEPPVSISIQAPWGGGKTSLMKMIRNELDKDAEKKYDENYNIDGNLTVTLSQLRKLLKKHDAEKKKLEIPQFENAGFSVKPRVTIWFNPWKYESTEQMWAGLADSIVRGVAIRMTETERLWFLLQLNLKFEGARDVLDWISRRIRSYLWKQIYPWLWAAIVPAGASIFLLAINYIALGISGLVGSAALGSIPSFLKVTSLENKPPDLSLGNYVKLPDYSKSLGYIHNTLQQLQIVFGTIPKTFLPMVIFVDDLDRCSPNRVAEVMEGINLFLSGELKNCIFVIGMDAEIVSAALEAEHSTIISKLPKYSTHTPIGWRFMDKFVQLPIVIPRSIQSDVTKYIDSLLQRSEDKDQIQLSDNSEDEKSKSQVSHEAPSKHRTIHLPKFNVGKYLLSKANKSDIQTRQNEIKQDGGIEAENSRSEKELANYPAEQRLIILKAAHMIDQSSELEKETREVRDSVLKFSANPREIKRFVNMLRFQTFLLDAMLAANKPDKRHPPSHEQLRRWIHLSLKWPAVIRWLYWSPDIEEEPEQQQTPAPAPTPTHTPTQIQTPAPASKSISSKETELTEEEEEREGSTEEEEEEEEREGSTEEQKQTPAPASKSISSKETELTEEEESPEENQTDAVAKKLKKLELLGATSKNQKDWERMLYRQWKLKSDSVFWVKDETLREFFRMEGLEKDQSKRLSAAVGRGLF
jgi:hypothetical protein